MNKVSNSIFYIGANDHDVDLFEGQYVVPNGMAYNSYLIADAKTVVMDTIAANKTGEWLANIEEVMNAISCPAPDYLVVQHMEPDHSASIQAFVEKYPGTTVVANSMTFEIMHQFFPEMTIAHTLEVNEGDTLPLGAHTLHFVFAPMVHWPEVMVTYESTEKVLFAADGFGKFGALDRDEPWADEARRYYIGIVGKYGDFVQDLLQKASGLEIQTICPLHGPVLKENLGYYLDLYDKWSGYKPEANGVVIAYTSVYGHTKEAVMILRDQLRAKGVPNVEVYDLARDDMAKAVDAAFRYDKLVLATTTYNAEIYPFMHYFLINLRERNFQNRTIGLIENGSWAPAAAGIMKDMLSDCKKLTYAQNTVTIRSALNKESTEQLMALADEMAAGYGRTRQKAPEIDTTALFKIGYGLYVVTCNDGVKDNGLIVNSVSQVSDNPNRVAVNINKANYSCEVINRTRRLNVCTLSEECTFDIFKRFGFQTGREADKFAGFSDWERAANGLPILTRYANGFLSLDVYATVDMGTHWLFLCDVTESEVLSSVNTMTYTYYQEHVKPKKPQAKKGWICNVCGYIYEEDELPADYVCPICKHGASDFSKLG